LRDGRPVAEQTIASPGFRLQQIPKRTECLANRHGMGLKQVVRDHCPWPDAIHQLILGDQPAGRLNQSLQDLKCPPADWNGQAANAKLAPSEVDFTIARDIGRRGMLCNHVGGLAMHFVTLVIGAWITGLRLHHLWFAVVVSGGWVRAECKRNAGFAIQRTAETGHMNV